MPLFFFTPFFSRLNRSSFKKYKQRAAHNISPIRVTLPCILSHQIIHGAFKAVSILNKITIKTNHFNNYLPVFFSFFFAILKTAPNTKSKTKVQSHEGIENYH